MTRRRAALVVMVAWTGLAQTRAIAAPAAGDELTVADLRWPTTTRSVTVRWRAHVLDDAASGKRVGVLARGARVGWRRIVATRDRCRAWLELEPHGWACALDLQPSDDAAVPIARDGDGDGDGPGERWADVRKDGADAYDAPDDIRAQAVARHVPDKTFVAVRGAGRALAIDGVRYWKTDQGWIASDRLAFYAPSAWSGLELADAPPPAWPFAWVVPHGRGVAIAVRADASATAAITDRVLAPREVVAVLEERGDFVRIADAQWAPRRELRVVRAAARPAGVGAGERWLDVDLDQQVLVAYDGDVAVFATLVSTGRRLWETPTGIYRITGKYARVRMQDPGGMAEEWNVADVPWTMRFRKNFALHGTYWHDGFGRARSHGCVNLSPHDARRLYDWTTPGVPDGWTEIADDGGTTGTPVRIHDRRDPDPGWRDFDGKPLAAP
jgi:L,D-transpeptidase catalytic domain